MIELTRRNILDFQSLDGTFNDSLLEIRQDRVFYEQSLNLNYIHGLSGTIDTNIKNYSSLYLTKKCLDTDIFKVGDERLNPPVIFTRIGAIPLYLGTLPLNVFLQFDKITQVVPAEDNIHSCSFNLEKNIIDYADSLFEIELLPESLCRIKHFYNGYPYYLSYGRDPELPTLSGCGGISPINLFFRGGPTDPQSSYDEALQSIIDQGSLSYSRSNSNVFEYNIFNNELTLFKTTTTSFISQPYGLGGGILTVSGPTVADISLTPVVIGATFPYNSTTTLYIDDTRINPDIKLNTSWVSYQKNILTTGTIDEDRSKFNIPNNNILHFEYNEISDKLNINILKLKNNLSDKNYTKRQSYMHGIVRPSSISTATSVITGDSILEGVLDTEDLTLSDLQCQFDVDSISLLTEDLSGVLI